MAKNIKSIICLSALGLVLAAVGAGNGIAAYWGDALEGALGTIGAVKAENQFKSNYESDEKLVEAQKEFVLNTSREGGVLLKNENNVLPLASGAKVSVFGRSSVEWVAGGKGSGAVATDTSLSVKVSLESAGLKVNPTLWDFTRSEGAKDANKRGNGTGAGAGNDAGDWRIGEISQDKYTENVKSSYAEYNDAAIVVFGRVGGEGSDLPKNMLLPDNKAGQEGEYAEGSHYLELDNYEKDLLKAVKDAGFAKIIVVINSANPIEMGFVDQAEYGISSALWLAGTGNNGIYALGELIAGKVNPSGRLVDTFAYDAFSSASMQNSGDFRYLNKNGDLIHHSYMVYAESIYVGYKYYETRYEDKITGRGNVGEYDYSTTVKYPFGYGLSYTNFTWSDFKVSTPDENNDVTISLKVTNTGTVSGKDVVEIYAQSPYTDYDIENGVSKASVSLVGFAKTSELANNDSEEVEIKVNLKDLASYDSNNKKTYLLEKSEDYYFTAAYDAHSAVNNILASKGKSGLVASPKESEAGNASLAAKFEVPNEIIFDKDYEGGETITNRFDFADITKETSLAYDAGFSYLSRNNWAKLEEGITYKEGSRSNVENAYVSVDTNKSVNVATASDELITALDTYSHEISGNPKKESDYQKVTTGSTKTKRTVSELAGKEYDDPIFEEILDQMSESDLHKLFRKAGYCTQEIESIQKNKEYDYDGPAGISNYLSGKSTFGYTSEIVLAATWNPELPKQLGLLIGEDGLKSNTTGWYAPAMNIHRTPFSGRNYEYYSEDSMLSGYMGYQTVLGAQEMGMYCDMKHFALNDQETNRSAIGCASIWANEQSIREIYLKPFQDATIKGKCHGAMTTMNRIGHIMNFGNYHLITEVLRNEWGFKGVVITDYVNPGDLNIDSKALAEQILGGGGDLIMNTAGLSLPNPKSNCSLNELRRAAHNTLYVVANSNSVSITGKASTGTPLYIIYLAALDAVTLIGVGIGVFFTIRGMKKKAS